jgi:uncharacterized repeat protein (TIGR01451 family)
MKTRKQKRWNPPAKKLLWMVAAALMLLNVHQAMASTAENTTITNTVTVSYEDAQGAAMDDVTATATVTVALVSAAPTITSAADIDPTNENTANILTYTVTGNANGDDSYTITFGLVNTDIGVVTVSDVPVILGGTTLAAEAEVGDTQITVPYDSNVDSDSDVTNGIAVADTIIIGGNPYVVASIAEDSGTNLTTIGLASPIADSAGAIGDIVGEQQEIDVTVTTGSLDSGATVGTYAVTATMSSDTDSSASAAQNPATTITVRLTQLSVAKYVRDVTNGTTGTGGSYDYNSATYYASVLAEPEATLEYIVVVTNDTGAALEATNVVIEDPIPQFTTFVSGTISLDPDIDDAMDPLVTLTDSASDDPGELDGDTVRIRAGSGGTDTVGGTLAEDQTTVGIFQVTID